jgi:hypothetical protein
VWGCEDCDGVKADGTTGVNFGGPPRLRLPSAQDIESVSGLEKGQRTEEGYTQLGVGGRYLTSNRPRP